MPPGNLRTTRCGMNYSRCNYTGQWPSPTPDTTFAQLSHLPCSTPEGARSFPGGAVCLPPGADDRSLDRRPGDVERDAPAVRDSDARHPSSCVTGPARTRRLRQTTAFVARKQRPTAASSGVAQPTTETEATATIPLVRARAQCTSGNLRGRGCGRPEDEPVNSKWISGAFIHSLGGASSTEACRQQVPAVWGHDKAAGRSSTVQRAAYRTQKKK